MISWKKYYETVHQPNRLVRQALARYSGKKRRAFDLGAGNMRDSKYLLEQGFRTVVAIDESPDARQYASDGIVFQQIPVNKFRPQKCSYAFGISCNTLFFVPRLTAGRVVDRAYDALWPGGVFACNFLGERDEWVVSNQENVSYLRSGYDVELLRDKYDPLELVEVEEDRPTALGKPKHWHCWEMILQKPAL